MSDYNQRVSQLRDLINDYRYNYHVLDKSIMSEAAADSLKRELAQLEAEHPELITADSPTQRVAGEPLPQFNKVSHSSRMLSLNDVFDQAEIQAWIERITKLAPMAKKNNTKKKSRKGNSWRGLCGRGRNRQHPHHTVNTA